MQLYDLQLNNPPALPRAVALGQFDGLHLGHRRVIAQAVGIEGLTTTVFSFSDMQAVKPQARLLLSPERKLGEMEVIGVQEWVTARFADLKELTPERFVQEVLHDMLHARVVCCGFNYRFGKNAAGDAQALTALCAPLGIQVVVVPPVELFGAPVSSERIRAAVRDGDMPLANRLLGHSFTIDTVVVSGQQLGREIGSPTINQPLPKRFVQPKFGVYLSAVQVGDKTYIGVTNIGVHPTVGETAPLAETWIADYDGDIYGEHIPTMPVAFLRGEQRFDSVEALRAQIQRDREAATALLEGDGRPAAVLFDFDDTLQYRDKAFMKFAAWFLQKYFPEESLESHQQRALDMLRQNNGGYVNYQHYFEGLLALWDWHPPMSVPQLCDEFQRRFPMFVTLFDDAEDTLLQLRQRGYQLGLVTNGPALQQSRKVDISGLRTVMDVVLVSGQEGVHKPAPELFCRAALRMGVAPERCVYVGDHPVNDIKGAESAGMMPVCIEAVGLAERPDTLICHDPSVTRITRLAELLDLLPDRRQNKNETDLGGHEA